MDCPSWYPATISVVAISNLVSPEVMLPQVPGAGCLAIGCDRLVRMLFFGWGPRSYANRNCAVLEDRITGDGERL
jgi:hypothetical protein